MNESTAELSVGAPPKWVAVSPRVAWNDTGIHVEPGQRYALQASGRWVDFFIRTGPGGFYRDIGRVADEPDQLVVAIGFSAAGWLCLVGCVGEGGEPFAIGTGVDDWSPPEDRSGPLLCYANDVPSARWNNWGTVQLQIRRRAP